jgi:diacylglycerol kinase family enzyme
VRRGAAVLGAAGGDGSQSAVAAVAAAHGLPFVCVPAGTRNHFALDAGIDRHDPVAALEAFFTEAERPVDLARVNGRVFCNNASMGLYGRIVQSPEYRQAKMRTVIEMLPELLGPRAAPADLRFFGPDGRRYEGAALLLVSNDRYDPDPVPGHGNRRGIDRGSLGVVAVTLGPQPVPLPEVREWEAATFVVEAGGPVEVGLDGEALALDPPLRFETVPGALRLRVAGQARARPVLGHGAL